jgi:hypothetical protein
MLLKRHGWATFTNADTEGSTGILPVSAERNKRKKSSPTKGRALSQPPIVVVILVVIVVDKDQDKDNHRQRSGQGSRQ